MVRSEFLEVETPTSEYSRLENLVKEFFGIFLYRVMKMKVTDSNGG